MLYPSPIIKYDDSLINIEYREKTLTNASVRQTKTMRSLIITLRPREPRCLSYRRQRGRGALFALVMIRLLD